MPPPHVNKRISCLRTDRPTPTLRAVLAASVPSRRATAAPGARVVAATWFGARDSAFLHQRRHWRQCDSSHFIVLLRSQEFRVLSVRLRRKLVNLFLAELGRSGVRQTMGHFGFRPG
jgi:hypothetical protein